MLILLLSEQFKQQTCNFNKKNNKIKNPTFIKKIKITIS